MHQNIVLIETTFYRCHLILDRIAPSFAVPSFKVAQSTMREARHHLQKAIMGGMPNGRIMAYVQGCITRMSEMEEWLANAEPAILQTIKSDGPASRQKLNLRLDAELKKYSGEMMRAHDKVSEFHERFTYDPREVWKLGKGEHD